MYFHTAEYLHNMYKTSWQPYISCQVTALCYLMPLAIQWRCGGLLFIHTGKTGGLYTKLPRCAISLQQYCLGMPAAAEQRPPQRL